MDRPLHVLLSSHSASPYGAERVLLMLALEFRAAGILVTLEFPHDGPAVCAARDAGLEPVVTGRARLPRNAWEFIRFAATWPRAVRAVRERIRTSGCDVVWVNSLYNPAAALAARACGVPVIWHMHERNFRGPAGRILAALVARCSSRIVAPSRSVAESFTAAGMPAGRCRILPNPLTRTIAAADLARNTDFVVAVLGQFERRKRVTDVLRAAALIPDLHVRLGGDGKARRQVERIIVRLELAGRVAMCGFTEDIAAFFAGCDCVVIPARDEPFGLVALEAMAAGRPIIAARSGALPEVLGDAALYYPPGDVPALAATIAALRADPARARELRDRGFDRLQHFDRGSFAGSAIGMLYELAPRTAAGAGC